VRVLGIDFTSRPTPRKPITCCECRLEADLLRPLELIEWPDFSGFEQALRDPGPWVAGLDFPFGQSRRLIETTDWPNTWAGYVEHAASLGRAGFRAALDAYRAGRPAGDKEHRRACDVLAGSISPQKLYGTPVGLMFFEGAPRLRAAGVSIPGLQTGDRERVVVEAYPGVLARSLIGRRGYKQDSKAKQTPEQAQARRDLLDGVTGPVLAERYGLRAELSAALGRALVADPGADRLDALLCAVQAAWAWRRRDAGFGLPKETDPLEGWIVDPALLRTG
jgi:hypothetical protein